MENFKQIDPAEITDNFIRAIKLPSFLKRIFHVYHFLEEKHFYKKNLVVEVISSANR